MIISSAQENLLAVCEQKNKIQQFILHYVKPALHNKMQNYVAIIPSTRLHYCQS